MTTFCLCVEFELYCPGSFSLKDKRRIIKGLRDKLSANYNVSTAEVDYQDQHRKAKLSVAAVNSSKKRLVSLKDKLVDKLDSSPRIQINNYSSQIY